MATPLVIGESLISLFDQVFVLLYEMHKPPTGWAVEVVCEVPAEIVEGNLAVVV